MTPSIRIHICFIQIDKLTQSILHQSNLDICAMVKSCYIGDGHPTFNRNPYNGYYIYIYINPYGIGLSFPSPILWKSWELIDPIAHMMDECMDEWTDGWVDEWMDG